MVTLRDQEIYELDGYGPTVPIPATLLLLGPGLIGLLTLKKKLQQINSYLMMKAGSNGSAFFFVLVRPVGIELDNLLTDISIIEYILNIT